MCQVNLANLYLIKTQTRGTEKSFAEGEETKDLDNYWRNCSAIGLLAPFCIEQGGIPVFGHTGSPKKCRVEDSIILKEALRAEIIPDVPLNPKITHHNQFPLPFWWNAPERRGSAWLQTSSRASWSSKNQRIPGITKLGRAMKVIKFQPFLSAGVQIKAFPKGGFPASTWMFPRKGSPPPPWEIGCSANSSYSLGFFSPTLHQNLHSSNLSLLFCVLHSKADLTSYFQVFEEGYHIPSLSKKHT